MYSKLSEVSLSRNSRKLNRNQPGESGMLPNWKLRFESGQSQFAPISPKIDALKFDYSAFDDAPAVVPLGIWAFSSLTRAVAGSGKGGAFRLESFRFNTIIWETKSVRRADPITFEDVSDYQTGMSNESRVPRVILLRSLDSRE